MKRYEKFTPSDGQTVSLGGDPTAPASPSGKGEGPHVSADAVSSIANIDDALLSWLCIVIKENVLHTVIGLIDQEQLSDLTMELVLFPVGIVLLRRHGAVDIHLFSHVAVLVEMTRNEVASLELVVTQSLVSFLIVHEGSL